MLGKEGGGEGLDRLVGWLWVSELLGEIMLLLVIGALDLWKRSWDSVCGR